MKRWFLALALLFPALAYGQGSNYQAIILGSTGRPVGGAQVTVCTAGSPGVPCSPTVNIFQDQALTIAQSNPIITDAFGNFSFWAAPGTYEYTVTGLNVVAHGPFTVVLPCIVGASCASAGGLPNSSVTFSTTPSFAATQNASYSTVLTANITAITITGTPVNGNLLRFSFDQDATGGHTVVWPGNFIFADDFAFRILPLAKNKITFVYNGTNWHQLDNIPDGALDYYPVTFSATPTLSNSRSAVFDMTLTGNVTSSVFTTTGRAGTQFILNACQDGVGGRTFAFPGNVSNPQGFTFDTTASHCNRVLYSWTGALWIGIGGGTGGGGGGTPANPLNCLQKNASGSFGASNVCENGTALSIGDDSIPKGPNPYVDPRAYGVRALDSRFIPGVPGITGTINSTSTSLTVSTSNCPAQASSQCFTNGDGITIVGGGAPQSMTAPVPTVVPSLAAGPTGTTVVVTGPTGATTYNYKIVAVDKGRGMTVASAATTITNGKANLGARSVGITSCARSGQTVTCLTSGVHELIAGAAVIINQVSDGSFSGTYILATVPDNTHFTYTSGFDTASGATTSATGGTVHWFNENLVSWSHVAGAHQYIICSDRGGAGYVPIGISAPDNTAASITDMALAWDDLGSPLRDNFLVPYWAGTNPCTAGSAQNDELVTTIVSGAPGTSFTLANAASTSVTNQVVLFDNVPNLLTALAASANAPLNIPVSTVSNGNMVFNSYMQMPSQYDICQLGTVVLNDTVQLASGGKWSGACPPANGSVPSSAWQGYTTISTGPAYPGAYQANGAINMDSIQWTNATGTNNKVYMLMDLSGVPSGTLGGMNFVIGGNMGIGLVSRGAPAGASGATKVPMKGNWLFSSPTVSVGDSTTPAFYASPAGYLMENISLAGRGLVFKTPSQPFGDTIPIKTLYMNGGITPLITMVGGGANQFIHLGYAAIDTVGLPLFANLNAVGSKITVEDLASGPSNDGVSVPPLVSGFSTPVIGVSMGAGYTRNAAIITGTGHSSTMSPGSPLLQQIIEGDIWVGTLHSIFINAPALAPPTGAVAAGGSVPVGTISYRVVPVWQNGGEGRYSAPASFTTTGGNQTVNLSWIAAPGNPTGYNLYRSTGGGFAILCGGLITTTSFSDTAAGTCGQVSETIPTGGPTMLMPGTQGIAAPKFLGGGYASTPTASKTSSYTPTANDNIIPADASAGGFTISLNPAIVGSHWTILRVDNVPGNVLTINTTSGTLDGAASATINVLSGKIFTCTGGNCQTEATSSAGSITVTPEPQYADTYYTGAGTSSTLGGNAPQTVNGTYVRVHAVTASAAVAPSDALLGIPVNTQTCSGYTLLYSDRASRLNCTGGTTATVTLPAIASNFGSNMPFQAFNGNSGNLTLTATSPNTIDGSGAGGSSVIFPGWLGHVTSDNTPSWLSLKVPTFAAFPPCLDTAGQHLNFSLTTGILCGTSSSGGGGGSSAWDLITNPATGNLALTMGTHLSEWDYATALSNAWKITNNTAATVTTPQNGPIVNLACGQEWTGAGASTEGCFQVQLTPGTGLNAQSLVAVKNTSSSTNTNNGFNFNGNIYVPAGGKLGINSQGNENAQFSAGGMSCASGTRCVAFFNTGNTDTGGIDGTVSRMAASLIGIGSGSAGSRGGLLLSANNQPQVTASYTNATTTPSTFQTWTLPASAQNYSYECRGVYSSSASTATLALSVNSSVAPTSLMASARIFTTLTGTSTDATVTTTSSGNQAVLTGATPNATSTNYQFSIYGTIEEPGAGGTFAIQAAAGGAGTVTILRGSTCTLY